MPLGAGGSGGQHTLGVTPPPGLRGAFARGIEGDHEVFPRGAYLVAKGAAIGVLIFHPPFGFAQQVCPTAQPAGVIAVGKPAIAHQPIGENAQ